MGRIRRGVLWALFPPAGAAASVRAGNKRDTRELIEAIREKGARADEAAPAAPPSPQAAVRRAELKRRQKEIDQLLRDAGFSDRAHRLKVHMQVINLVAAEGLTLTQAIEQITAWRAVD